MSVPVSIDYQACSFEEEPKLVEVDPQPSFIAHPVSLPLDPRVAEVLFGHRLIAESVPASESMFTQKGRPYTVVLDEVLREPDIHEEAELFANDWKPRS